ncbi:MAG TPA: Asp-tRNA(Asn)/Glu-tRNA(Gln) amidotransferase subunit GatA [Candidatus Blautia intestinavium]|nr:Asp-tRNA(Asn)/Glu-tRNA(Gln) amidotransferase subunit GatA [Candidatus Blautia intestinavium]
MDLEKMTALELAEKIKQRQISVLDGVKTVFAEIEKKENRIHAYLDIYKKEAYARARQVEKGIAEGIYTGPLAGVPVAVKDNICVKGKKTTCASRMLENFVPPYQAEAVSRLEQAGMIVIGKTNMDEFAMGSTTETSAYGITRNPWNTDHVPGGSSGGSCAAVAAGEAYLALGSDTGGSIRQPSSFCGVTGVKPTYGTVSRYGLIAYASSLDQIGPIGKNTADCAALLEVIAGRDPKDSTSLDRKDLDFSEAMDQKITGMKFGIPKEYLAKGLDGEVKNSFMEALKILTGQGAIVEFFSVDTMEYMIPAYYIIASAEASSNLERFDGVKYGYRAADYEGLHDMYYRTRTEGFGEEVKRRIMLGSFVLSSGYYDAYYLKALRAKALICQEFDRAFEKYDVILAPAAPHTAPKIGESLKDPLSMYLGDIYTVAVNLCGLPAISVPCGMDSKGLPIGIQMIGNRFEEKKIFRSAAAFERGGRD